MRPASHHNGCRFGSAFSQTSERCKHAATNHHERTSQLQLLDVLGEIARSHPLMNLFVTSQRTELIDAGLHIVASDTFTGVDGIEVDLINDTAIGIDRVVGHRNTEVTLGFKDCQPEFSLKNDLLFGRPQSDHLRARIPSSKNIGHRRGRHSVSSRAQSGHFLRIRPRRGDLGAI